MKHLQKTLLICMLALAATTACGQKNTAERQGDASLMQEADQLASLESTELAETFDIRDTQDRKELDKACRKYFRAWALLLRQYPDQASTDYIRRFKVLDREYARELQQVLPHF